MQSRVIDQNENLITRNACAINHQDYDR